MHVQKNAVVVDVGIHRVSAEFSQSKNEPKKKLCGDVKSDEVAQIASAITPVPGGVGPMTIACLMVNTVTAACWGGGVDLAYISA